MIAIADHHDQDRSAISGYLAIQIQDLKPTENRAMNSSWEVSGLDIMVDSVKGGREVKKT